MSGENQPRKNAKEREMSLSSLRDSGGVGGRGTVAPGLTPWASVLPSLRDSSFPENCALCYRAFATRGSTLFFLGYWTVFCSPFGTQSLCSWRRAEPLECWSHAPAFGAGNPSGLHPRRKHGLRTPRDKVPTGFEYATACPERSGLPRVAPDLGAPRHFRRKYHTRPFSSILFILSILVDCFGNQPRKNAKVSVVPPGLGGGGGERYRCPRADALGYRSAVPSGL